MRWRFLNARECFPNYQRYWSELNRHSVNHVLLDGRFVADLVRYFATSETLLAVSEDNDKPGIALCQRTGRGFWQCFQPSQAPIGLILFPNAAMATMQIQAMVRALPGCALGFAITQQDPDYTAFKCLDASPKVEIVEYIKTGRLTLEGTFENYWQARGRDLVANVARRYRRLEKQGIEVRLTVDADAERMADCIREYGRMEGIGWKGRAGTAVSAHNQQGLFYRSVMEGMCSQAEGVVYRLLFDGETVGSQLGLKRDGMVVLLKTAFDEGVKEFSPGFLLQREILKHLFLQGNVKVVEFYGRIREGWTTKWTSEIRSMHHINVYRHGYIPVMRRFVKRICRSNDGIHETNYS